MRVYSRHKKDNADSISTFHHFVDTLAIFGYAISENSLKRHRGASIVRLIAHKRGLVGDKGEVMFPHLTLTETVGIFAVILLDLCVQLCYDSIKTCHTLKGLTDERDSVT